jgi:hypothetical protein
MQPKLSNGLVVMIPERKSFGYLGAMSVDGLKAFGMRSKLRRNSNTEIGME